MRSSTSPAQEGRADRRDDDTPTLSTRLERIAFVFLQIAIVWAPWPLGSYRNWALGVLATIVWAGLLIGLAGRALAPQPEAYAGRAGRSGGADRPTVSRYALIPFVSLLGFTALLALQLVPGLGEGGGTISIDPWATRVYLLTTLVYLGAWALVSITVRSAERVSSLLATVVAAGVLQAMAAVFFYSTGARYTLFFTEFQQGGRATATFPNPDHLAAYLEVTLAASLGWLLSQFRNEEPSSVRNWRTRTVAVLAFVMSGKMLLRLVMVTMVIALVMTHSRMGNGAFFIGIAVIGLLVAIRSPRLRRAALWLVLSMAVIDVFIIGQWVGLDRVVQRLQGTAETTAVASGFGQLADPEAGAPRRPVYREESIQDRLRVPWLSMAAVQERPWLGHGGGTYADAFPPTKPSGDGNLSMYWDHAHDDYVQVASDTGPIGLALWVTIGLASFVRAVRLLGDRYGRQARGIAAAAAMGVFCLGLHSLVDFGLHVPAIALTLTILLAALWSAPEQVSTGRRRRQRRPADIGEGDDS